MEIVEIEYAYSFFSIVIYNVERNTQYNAKTFTWKTNFCHYKMMSVALAIIYQKFVEVIDRCECVE